MPKGCLLHRNGFVRHVSCNGQGILVGCGVLEITFSTHERRRVDVLYGVIQW